MVCIITDYSNTDHTKCEVYIYDDNLQLRIKQKNHLDEKRLK